MLLMPQESESSDQEVGVYNTGPVLPESSESEEEVEPKLTRRGREIRLPLRFREFVS